MIIHTHAIEICLRSGQGRDQYAQQDHVTKGNGTRLHAEEPKDHVEHLSRPELKEHLPLKNP